MMPEHRVKRTAKRLRKVLRDLGIEFWHSECLELAARLCGFDDWNHFRARDIDEPLSLFDEYLSDEGFAARDAYQMSVLLSAGLGEVARELLDRANPTGSWARQPPQNPGTAVSGNEPGRGNHDTAPAAG